ncbi:MAG: hypothetical protein J6Y78_18180 [Paludibacteraceae bacterium]|nr:hypothetical protein [Paludibacteraceae bacterium]
MPLTPKQHNELLNQALQANVTFKLLEGVIPCRIIIDGNYYNLYVKNLSSAHFSNENVWRAQLPADEKFAKMKESSIPFVFLGYDEENDVYATWNPHKVKQRLNEAKYVSFYSRLSAQKSAHDENKFVRLKLNNEGEVLIFPRMMLSSYLVNMQTYFPDMSDYVAMGSKRRIQANETYRELNNSKNIALYAKFLEEMDFVDISLYCRWLKHLINNNKFSSHRKDFLAYDSIAQYDAAIERFMKNEDIIALDTTTDGCIKDMLKTYIEFLKVKLENVNDSKTEKDNDLSQEECSIERPSNEIIDFDKLYLRNGKITKVVNPEVLHLIEPHLNTEYKEPIVAVNILNMYYSDKYDLQMEFKDWIKLIQNIDWSTCYNTSSILQKKIVVEEYKD